jgi:hypothetical protein
VEILRQAVAAGRTAATVRRAKAALRIVVQGGRTLRRKRSAAVAMAVALKVITRSEDDQCQWSAGCCSNRASRC